VIVACMANVGVVAYHGFIWAIYRINYRKKSTHQRDAILVEPSKYQRWCFNGEVDVKMQRHLNLKVAGPLFYISW
jgi:hypothetical protein